jgi:hypothetical protein
MVTSLPGVLQSSTKWYIDIVNCEPKALGWLMVLLGIILTKILNIVDM